MILPSGTEEYFNKKKTLNTKCWGVRAIALRPLTVSKNYSNCIIIRTYASTLYVAYCRYEILHTIISFFQIDITFNVSLNKVTKY